MAPLAMRLLRIRAIRSVNLVVHSTRHGDEVVGVDAHLVPAGVVDYESARNRPDTFLPCHPMGCRSPVGSTMSPGVARPRPIPALVGLTCFDSLPKPGVGAAPHSDTPKPDPDREVGEFRDAP